MGPIGQAAARGLVTIGQAVVPAMKERLDADDSDVLANVHFLLDELGHGDLCREPELTEEELLTAALAPVLRETVNDPATELDLRDDCARALARLTKPTKRRGERRARARTHRRRGIARRSRALAE